MSTFETLTLMISFGLLIITLLSFDNEKSETTLNHDKEWFLKD